MTPFAFGLVMLAAVLHASWNAMVKGAADRGLALAAMTTAHVAFGLVGIAVFPAPAVESWPYIIASTVIHYGYYVLLYHAYRLGDLSQVYPVSRGVAPALVALGAYVVIGEILSPAGMAGLVAVCVGICLLALFRGAGQADRRAVLVALILGVNIAFYSTVDGIGVRLADSPLGYVAWLHVLEVPVVAWMLTRRWRAGLAIARKPFMVGLLGGAFSVVAYSLALYAATLAPLAAVSAVRESSVIIAAIIGLVVFGERPWIGRLVSAAIVAMGVAALAVAG